MNGSLQARAGPVASIHLASRKRCHVYTGCVEPACRQTGTNAQRQRLLQAACGKPKPATSSGWTDDETDSKVRSTSLVSTQRAPEHFAPTCAPQLPPTTAPELGRHVSRFLSDLKRSMHKSTPPTTSRALPPPPPSKPGQGKAPVLSEVQVRKLVAQRRLAQQSNRFSDSVMGTPTSPPAPAPPLLPLPYSLSDPEYRPSPPAAPPPGHPSHRAHSLPHCPDQAQGQAGASSTLLLKPLGQGLRPAGNTTHQAVPHTKGQQLPLS
ncbi:hypothetical protein QJQ45_013841 [Haematococcus lacustris]|nr:hypothetical protein QJQ45_013841 [Haematococcus lacustris]